jgi:hypothetical protein
MLGVRLNTESHYYASPDGVVLATTARPPLPFAVAARAIA